ncbi:MAG: UDP-N-acetylmuramate--L-alanine ligase [Bacteroidales bacterium]|jgi:UDP-N-acetylmuramate--alanine ligase|nr:UDP-N-acetylmuramate--L-alanine ligase [Bacteroidales bacterium]
MNLSQFTHIYLIGIGGIGMSALARYFMANNKLVAGYDLASSPLTELLEKEGASIHFEDDLNKISATFLNKINTLIIYTPAIPKTNKELNFFIDNDYVLLKRSQVLGLISLDKNCIAIAGTHGKTTVSSMTAHILNNGKMGCNAFLGGIANNYNSNLILNENSRNLVVEADEFDRSFLHLSPNLAVITSMDADHLDIFSNHQGLKKSFQEFVDLIHPEGILLVKKELKKELHSELPIYTYSPDDASADFKVEDMQLIDGIYQFTILGPGLRIENVLLGMPGKINVENALAAAAIAYLCIENTNNIKNSLYTFSGVKRRMEYIIKRTDLVYLDDYAHHPEEIKASILSVKALYPDKKVTGIFQPHLYSRTRDFLNDFAKSLALLDQLILLEIYPAREEPIPGINSKLLLNKIPMTNKILLQKADLIPFLKSESPHVILSLGAGDIDRLVDKIKAAFE